MKIEKPAKHGNFPKGEEGYMNIQEHFKSLLIFIALIAICLSVAILFNKSKSFFLDERNQIKPSTPDPSLNFDLTDKYFAEEAEKSLATFFNEATGSELEELTRNVSYLSLLTNIESEEVLMMLIFATNKLSEDYNVQMSPLDISRQMYESEKVSSLLKSENLSFAMILSLYIGHTGASGFLDS